MDRNNIVKPVKQKPKLVDKRNKYLNGWRSLFENIHSEIKVVLHFEQDFNKTLDGLLSGKDFQGFNQNAKIIITLPKDFELEYLIGLGYDRMYSEREVIQDHFTVTENNLDSYQPETNSWESFYDEVYEISKTVLSEIPKPNYGSCSVCGKQTKNNPFYAGDNPICSQKCLYEWDCEHPNADK